MNHRVASALSILLGSVFLWLMYTFGQPELGDFITAVGIIAAISTAIFQLGAYREAEAAARRIELETTLYERITRPISGASPTGIATRLHILVSELRAAESRERQGQSYKAPLFRGENLHEMYMEIHPKLWAVSSDIERYEIAGMHLPLFRAVLNKRFGELGNQFAKVEQLIPYLLLTKNGIIEDQLLMRISSPIGEELERRIEEFAQIAYDVAALLYDVQIEFQNLFLQKHFMRKLERRRPNNEGHLVLTSESEGELQKLRAYVDKNDQEKR